MGRESTAAKPRQNRVKRIIAKLLRTRQCGVANRSTTDETYPSPTSAARFATELQERLEASRENGFNVGCVNIITLDLIKERLGADWPRVSERAKRIASNVIARHMLRGDLFSALPNESYIILFGKLTEIRAQIKARLIAKEIASALLGEEEGDAMHIKTASRGSDNVMLFKDVAPLAELMQAAIISEATARRPPEELVAVGNSAPIIAPVADAGPLLWTPMKVPAAEKPLLLWEPLRPFPDAAPKAAPSSSHPREKPVFAYLPVWDTRLNAIAGYRCTASDFDPAPHHADVYAEVDFAALMRVAKDMHDINRIGKQVLLTLPVHFETLSSARMRQLYVNTLQRELPEGALPLLVIEVVGVPDGVLRPRLIEIVSPLQSVCRAIAVRLSLTTNDFSAFGGARVAIVGCFLPPRQGSDAQNLYLLSRFCEGAERAGLSACLGGASDLSRVVAAVGAGFRFMHGAGIAATVERPRAPFKLELYDLYRPL